MLSCLISGHGVAGGYMCERAAAAVWAVTAPAVLMAHSAPWGGKRCACDGASQVVLGIAVAAGKMRTGEAQDGLDWNSGPALPEQVSGDPEIYGAPIGLRKAFANMPSRQTAPVDCGGL